MKTSCNRPFDRAFDRARRFGFVLVGFGFLSACGAGGRSAAVDAMSPPPDSSAAVGDVAVPDMSGALPDAGVADVVHGAGDVVAADVADGPGDAMDVAARDTMIADTADAGSSAGDSALLVTMAYPPTAVQGDIAAGIAQLNRYRVAVGESAVILDVATNAGCEGHLAYLIEEAKKQGVGSYLEHTESDTSNSHYSAANEAAGLESDLAFGSSSSRNTTQYQSLSEAVDLWINGLYHRRPLLDPGLAKVGAASSMGYNCLDYGAPGNSSVVKAAQPVLWPADGMTDVPRTFGGSEGPCPTAADPLSATSCGPGGFIPSAVFYGWGTARQSAIRSVSNVTLTDESTQGLVPLFAWYADKVAGHDPATGYVMDEIAVVPQGALTANRTYRVDVTGTAQAAQLVTNLFWRFTTGTRN